MAEHCAVENNTENPVGRRRPLANLPCGRQFHGFNLDPVIPRRAEDGVDGVVEIGALVGSDDGQTVPQSCGPLIPVGGKRGWRRWAEVLDQQLIGRRRPVNRFEAATQKELSADQPVALAGDHCDAFGAISMGIGEALIEEQLGEPFPFALADDPQAVNEQITGGFDGPPGVLTRDVLDETAPALR